MAQARDHRLVEGGQRLGAVAKLELHRCQAQQCALEAPLPAAPPARLCNAALSTALGRSRHLCVPSTACL